MYSGLKEYFLVKLCIFWSHQFSRYQYDEGIFQRVDKERTLFYKNQVKWLPPHYSYFICWFKLQIVLILFLS